MKTKIKVVPVSLTLKDYKAVVNMANKYTGGSVAGWLRYAATQMQPKPEHFITVKILKTKLTKLE